MNDAQIKCELEDVAAYLDGELDGRALVQFEEHVKQCRECAVELRAQRQLLCTLDVAFNQSNGFDLPSNFSRVVTARAENDLAGMRNGHERKRAIQLCLVLALISFGLLGAATRAIVFDPLRSSLVRRGPSSAGSPKRHPAPGIARSHSPDRAVPARGNAAV